MQRILTSLFALALCGLVLAGPPVDYELTCEVDTVPTLLGVLSVVEGDDGARIKIAPVDGAVCDVGAAIAVSPDGVLDVELSWTDDGPLVSVYLLDGETEQLFEGDLDVVGVPLVAVEGMLGAHRNRAAAMERRAAGPATGNLGRERAMEVSQGRAFQDDEPDDDDELEIEGGDDDGRPLDVPRGRP